MRLGALASELAHTRWRRLSARERAAYVAKGWLDYSETSIWSMRTGISLNSV